VEAINAALAEAESVMLAQARALSQLGTGIEETAKLAGELTAALDKIAVQLGQATTGYGEACDQLDEINRQLLAIRQALGEQGAGGQS
jgi:hypothetical protein